MAKYSRRHFIKAAEVGATAIALRQCDFEPFAGKEKPNIIFIMSDDHATPAISSQCCQLKEFGVEKSKMELISV